jgi:hypothetical protein
MSFDNIWQWSETAASNTAIASVDITGTTGKVKDGDNAIRAVMSQIITAEGKGTAIASAATLTLSGPERYFHITGSTGPITDIDFTDAVDGRWAWLIFDSTPTLTHNGTTLQLPGAANIVAAAGDRALFVQDSSDNVICLVYQRAAARPLEASGTYTPTLTNTTNVTGSTASLNQWRRVGKVVTVSGLVRVQATTANTLTVFGMTLPVASDFANSFELGGAGNIIGGSSTQTGGWSINASGGSDQATFTGVPTSNSNLFSSFSFTYLVI